MAGYPVGAIRVSLGMASAESDVTRLIELLTDFRSDAGVVETPRAAVA